MGKTGAARLPTLIMSDAGKMVRVKIMFASLLSGIIVADAT
jgi:hypothetical protein